MRKSRPGALTGSDLAPISEFERSYGFAFDPFQRRACTALLDGSSVLVAAPTGAGKTVVGEFAAFLARRRGGKTFYTTPIKALSNQKYGDFVSLHGAANVGLLTGDNSINGNAPIVVMTTEVLRNMIYEDSPTLDDLRYVVLDEVHYLQDRYRGAVWEEVLIHLPIEVLTASLSATVSNAEEFAEWLQTIRGRTEVIIEEHRPVDIRHWYMAADELLPMFVHAPNGEVMPNRRGREFDRRRRTGAERPQRGGRRVRDKRRRIPLRSDVVERLQSEGMLPAIYFIFSRKGCDEAIRQCVRDGVSLTGPDERREILAAAEERVADLSASDLETLGYDEWIEGLRRGLAAHHAGMIPAFKETVEQLFSRGLIKAVFATETLALGINMPARTIVIESLMKFTGERHEQMTPGEYTQLSGRAGRRGLDEVGHCVVLLQRFVPFDAITRLASTRTYPLKSSFLPSYNMAVNLVRNYDRSDAEHLVNSSFAQYQADRDVVQLEQTRERLDAYLASYRERVRCDLGDFDSYLALQEQVEDLKARYEKGGPQDSVVTAMRALRPGDVIYLPGGRRRGRYAVLEVNQRNNELRPKVLALSEERSMVRLGSHDFREPPEAVSRVRMPDNFRSRDAGARRRIAAQLANVSARPQPRRTRELAPSELDEARRALAEHPCAACPELGRHRHFATRAARLEREIAGIDRRIHRRTETLARRFERVLEVLEHFGCVREWSLTTKGEMLAGIYNESDLLIVEALEQRVLAGLDVAELAAVLSTLVYETRGPDLGPEERWPTKSSATAYRSVMRLWRSIKSQEEERGLELTREPDPGFVERAHLWASGAPLDEVLRFGDAPGDFVRATKQLVDLLRQLEQAAGDELAGKVRAAVVELQRGVVAYSSLDV